MLLEQHFGPGFGAYAAGSVLVLFRSFGLEGEQVLAGMILVIDDFSRDRPVVGVHVEEIHIDAYPLAFTFQILFLVILVHYHNLAVRSRTDYLVAADARALGKAEEIQLPYAEKPGSRYQGPFDPRNGNCLVDDIDEDGGNQEDDCQRSV